MELGAVAVEGCAVGSFASVSAPQELRSAKERASARLRLV
jgi:hypothetical protein